MASNPETRFGKRFRKKLPNGHDIRVENPAHPGTPDLNACINGIEFWVEFKQVESFPKLSDTPVFRGCLKPHQALWHLKRSQAGGRSFIVAGVLKEDITYIIPGKHAMEFNVLPRSRLDELTIPLESIWSPNVPNQV